MLIAFRIRRGLRCKVFAMKIICLLVVCQRIDKTYADLFRNKYFECTLDLCIYMYMYYYYYKNKACVRKILLNRNRYLVIILPVAIERVLMNLFNSIHQIYIGIFFPVYGIPNQMDTKFYLYTFDRVVNEITLLQYFCAILLLSHTLQC